MYERFHDKFINWDGSYIDISEILLGDSYYALGGLRVFKQSNSMIPENTLALLEGAEVLSVLGRGEILTIDDGKVLHIKGLTGSYVDGEHIKVPNPVICTGTYKYISAVGATKTVSSYSVCDFPSKTNFARLINSGVELVEYEKILKGKRGRIYKKSDIDGKALDGTIYIRTRRGGRAELRKGEYHYEIIKKPIR